MSEEASKTTAGRARTGKYEVAKNRAKVRRRARSIVLGDDTWERISIESIRTGVDRSQIVDTTMAAALRQYVISDRGQEDLASQETPARDPVETLPIGETLTSSPDPVTTSGAKKGRGDAPRLQEIAGKRKGA